MLVKLIILSLVQESFGFSEFLESFQSSILEDLHYCALKIEEDEFLPLQGHHYISYSDEALCSPTLIIQSISSISNSVHSCNERNHFIKSPNETFLFLNHLNMALEFQYSDFPCTHLLANQPYFFVATLKSKTKIAIEEVQVYSKTIVMVAEWTYENSNWMMNHSTIQTIQVRRSNFHGTELLVHYSTHKKFGTLVDETSGNLQGYTGEISALLSKEFNLTLKLTPIENFGVKLANGSYTGSVLALKENQIDVGMALFENTPARLEVVEAGLATISHTYKLFYFKERYSVIIYGLIFSQELWLAIVGLLVFSSIYFFFEAMLFKDKKQKFTKIFEVVITKAKLLLPTNSDEKIHLCNYSTRVYLVVLGIFGALLVWAYSGVLVSYFSIETESMPISTFEDLVAKPNLKILMQDGTSSAQLFMDATKGKPMLQEALKENIKIVPTLKEMEQEFLDKEDSSLMMFCIGCLESVPISDQYKLCNVQHGFLDGLKTKDKSGWLYPKHSILKLLFDNFLLKLLQSGEESRLQSKYFNTIDQVCKSSFDPVGMRIVMVLFKILSIGSGLAFLTLLIEWAVKRFQFSSQLVR